VRYKKPMIARALLVLCVFNFTLAAQSDLMHVVILEGDGAINNVRSPRAKEPIVRVEDDDKRGIAGAVVTFLLPADGPGGFFGDGGSSLTLTTDDRGEAMARGLHANRTPGTFQIRVTASQAGRTASAEISQTNVDPGTHSSSRMIAILAIVGGAAAGGAALAFRGGKSKSAAAGPSGTVVVPGTPTVGGPQ
jgi:hypothetical protein